MSSAPFRLPTTRADRLVDGPQAREPRWFPGVLLVGLGALYALLLGAVLLGWLPRGTPGGSGPPFWPIFPFGFFLVVLLVFVAFRWACWGAGWGGHTPWPARDEAQEILRERYARGEITRDQLLAMSSDLEHPAVRG
ncbi:MAG: hypothetical protein L3K07_01535 [Thermoplasmata archaeon]|nr:hypothetical protein [Thermoplasmata archaeon]